MNDVASRERRTQSAVSLAEAGWFDVLTRVIHGFCHDLNGRVTSLDAVQQLVEMGEPPSDLSYERDRLSQTVNALSMIAGDLGGPQGPLMLEDIVTSALELASRARRDLSEAAGVDVAEDVMPVRVNETRAMHAIVVLIDALASAAGRFPRLRVEGEDAEVRLLLDHGPGSGAIPQVPEEVLVALKQLLALDGGVITETGGGLQVAFPSLAALRGA